MQLSKGACCAVMIVLSAIWGAEAQRTAPAPRRSNADWVRCDARLTEEVRKADAKAQVRRVDFGAPRLAAAAPVGRRQSCIAPHVRLPQRPDAPLVAGPLLVAHKALTAGPQAAPLPVLSIPNRERLRDS